MVIFMVIFVVLVIAMVRTPSSLLCKEKPGFAIIEGVKYAINAAAGIRKRMQFTFVPSLSSQVGACINFWVRLVFRPAEVLTTAHSRHVPPRDCFIFPSVFRCVGSAGKVRPHRRGRARGSLRAFLQGTRRSPGSCANSKTAAESEETNVELNVLDVDEQTHLTPSDSKRNHGFVRVASVASIHLFANLKHFDGIGARSSNAARQPRQKIPTVKKAPSRSLKSWFFCAASTRCSAESLNEPESFVA